MHRINENIDAAQVRLIDEDGQQVGVVPLQQAMNRAQSEELDLVEIAPNSEPPVCRLMDYGKFLYTTSKKRHDSKRKQKGMVIKEIKFRPSIEQGDYNVKLGKLKDFLSAGNKTKVTMRFRGREFAHQELGQELLERVKDDLIGLGSVEQEPALEGRQMVMVLTPIKTASKREI